MAIRGQTSFAAKEAAFEQVVWSWFSRNVWLPSCQVSPDLHPSQRESVTK